jgi:Fe2+ transport system protein FeoA
MGLTKGVECTLVRIAPMGDPIEIMVRGYRLSLRKSEASGVLIAKG